MSRSSYNCDAGRAPMGKISAPKAKPTKVISKGSGKEFASPSQSQVAFSAQGGTKK